MSDPTRFTVLRDTREQQGWDFAPSKYCAGTQAATLKTGDYTLPGLEGSFVIERKASTAEFYKNVFEDRFERELERLDSYEQPYVVLEFTLEDLFAFPKGSGIPPARWRFVKARGPFLVKRLLEMQWCHRARFLLAGGKGKELAMSLFKRARGARPEAP